MDAKGANGNDINGSLRVAEFKPPNFKLDLTLESGENAVAAGARMQASLDGAYLFGAPLQGGVAHAAVTRYGASYVGQVPGLSRSARSGGSRIRRRIFDSDVSQNDYTLDAQGKATFPFRYPTDLPFPMTYNVDVRRPTFRTCRSPSSSTFPALATDAIDRAFDPTSSGRPRRRCRFKVIVLDREGRRGFRAAPCISNCRR